MRNRSVLDRFFPAKYNFFDLISQQAQVNTQGVFALNEWLVSEKDSDADALEKCRDEADEVRMKLENDLVEAFSTPIERGDIYLFSVDMDKVIEYALSTLMSMRAFGVNANNIIKDMVFQLKKGTELFCEAVNRLKNDPAQAEHFIPDLRSTHAAVERLYIAGMAALFSQSDPMHALKLREVYHHIKDASYNLDESVDILHKIIVGLT